MRLIDVDRLLKEFPIRINHYDKENGNFRYVLGIEAVMDYVKEMPTVEAIPIEWIKGYTDSTLDDGNSQMLGFKAAIIKEMVEEWEKENETN